MFTIQYTAVNGESKMQDLDSNKRAVLLKHLAKFEHPILAVYERATPITKYVRNNLRMWGPLSRAAQEFVNSPL